MLICNWAFCVRNARISQAPSLRSRRQLKPRLCRTRPITAWRRCTGAWEKQKRPARRSSCSSRSPNRKARKPNVNAARFSSLCIPFARRILRHRLQLLPIRVELMRLVPIQKSTAPPELRWGGEGNFRSIRCDVTLESELQPELNEARVVHRVVYLTKAKCPDVVDRQAELRVVEQVEELRPEVQVHILPRQRELLDDGEVRVHEVWTVDGHARSIPEATDPEVVDRTNEASRVNVLETLMAGRVGITTRDFVRAIKVVPVAAVVKRNSGLIKGVN